VVKEEKKPDRVTQQTTKPDENKPDVASANDQKSDPQTNPANQASIYKRSEVVKLSEGSSADGFESIYVDQNPDGTRDTVRVFIPERKNDSAIETKNLNAPSDTVQAKEEPKKEEAKKWWQISIGKNKTETAAKNDAKKEPARATTNLSTSDTSQAANVPGEESKKEENKKWWQISIGKNKTETTETKKCQTVASNDDFLKLRRKMAGRTNDDGMLDEAKKYFKSTCFSTEQVKNLSTMFLSNAGKFNFFTAAYNHTTDVENFSSLQSELKGEEYINRFKEMVNN
jgi:hypothetical protein